MALPIVTTGDPIEVKVTLWNDGAVQSLVGTIKAAVQDGNGNELIAATIQSSSTTGANWTTGVVAIYFPASVNSLTRGDAYIELQYTATSDGIPRTWPLIHIWVQSGVIS